MSTPRTITILPDCMMPDGADPCEGYKQVMEQLAAVTSERDRFKVGIAAMKQRIVLLHGLDPLQSEEIKEAANILFVEQTERRRAEAALARAKIISVRIIPWEPGMLGVEMTSEDGYRLAQVCEYLPNCRTQEHLKAEAALAQAERRGMERAAEIANGHGSCSGPFVANAILSEAGKPP